MHEKTVTRVRQFVTREITVRLFKSNKIQGNKYQATKTSFRERYAYISGYYDKETLNGEYNYT
jgi:hypothetical protein